MNKVIAICVSEKKGTSKSMIDEAIVIKNFGIKNDAHAGKWHRQVSLLGLEKIDAFNAKGGGVNFGDFGENLVISGIELTKLPIGQRFKVGETILELTQIGKQCHDKCEIFYRVGQCIMPTNGVFTRVLKGGKVRVGDEVTLLESEKKTLSL